MDNETRDFYEYIEKRLKELYEDGIILLEPLSKSEARRVYHSASKFSNVAVFSIGEGDNQRIVLKHSVKYDEFINIRELYDEAYQAYTKKDFETCIAIGRKLLTFSHVSSWMYGRIGVSYMHIGQINTAIKYLTVATEISKKEHTNYDYTDIILSLKEKKKNMHTDIEIKPMIKMTEEDFEKDKVSVDNLANIAIDFSSGLSLDEIAEKWSLDINQISTVLLIFAQQYYCEGNDIMGDKCMKWIARLPKKSKEVLSLYKEIIKNKPVYLNKAKFIDTNAEDNNQEKRLSLAFRVKI